VGLASFMKITRHSQHKPLKSKQILLPISFQPKHLNSFLKTASCPSPICRVNPAFFFSTGVHPQLLKHQKIRICYGSIDTWHRPPLIWPLQCGQAIFHYFIGVDTFKVPLAKKKVLCLLHCPLLILAIFRLWIIPYTWN
jgi:hypothetical protein